MLPWKGEHRTPAAGSATRPFVYLNDELVDTIQLRE